MTSTAIIITTFEWPEALELVFASAALQTVMPEEIHIADDGSGSETATVIDRWRQRLPFPVFHHWHRNLGFRPNPVRNEAIANCRSDLVITIDGDMIMHPEFVADHQAFSRPGYFIQSRRVRLDKVLTENLLQRHRYRIGLFERGVRRRWMAIRSRLLAHLTTTQDQSMRRIRGANMSFWRKDLLAVNGLNEDFRGWGFEDHELTARLFHAGLKRTYLRHAGLAYHLDHADNSRDRKSLNQAIFQQTLLDGTVCCRNGLAENHRVDAGGESLSRFCGRDRVGSGGVSDDVVVAENRNLHDGEAFAHLDDRADADEIAVRRFAHEIDVQAGGDR